MQGLFAEAPLNKTNTHITHGDNAQEGQARVQEFILCLKDFLSIAVFGLMFERFSIAGTEVLECIS